MDLVLSLELGHAVASIVWLAGGAVLALILLAAGRDDAAALRAVGEVEIIGRRVMLPAAVLTLLSGLVLAVAAGLAFEAWVWLSTALLAAALVARRVAVAPALAGARQDAQAAHRALGLVLRDLGAQVGVLVLMVVKPGWTGAAILLGLGVCIALAVALLRSLPDGEAQPA